MSGTVCFEPRLAFGKIEGLQPDGSVDFEMPSATMRSVRSISAKQLLLLIERIERLEKEKAGIADDIKHVYGEAKSIGFDTRTMRTIVRLRKMEKHHRDDAEMLLETYKKALGLV